MMQGYNQQQNLPVPFNQIDQRFFNNNLPDGNDAVPQLQLSQWMQQNQAVALKAIGLLRAMAQGGCQKSPVHVFVYNLLCQNGFQNQTWHQYAQLVTDFTEFLILVKGYPAPPPPGYQGNGQDAAMVAAQKVHQAALGKALATYSPLQQVVDPNLIPALQQAFAMHQSIVNDVTQYRNGAFSRPSNAGYQPQNLPPIQVNNYQQQQTHGGYSHAQVSGQANIASHHNGNNVYSVPGADSGEVQNSLYDVPNQQPLVPKEVISNEVPYDNAYYSEPQPMQQPTYTQQPVIENTDLPVPTGVKDVVVDPTYYQPEGFKLDINRAFDIIHNPGGVVIVPAQLSEWEITPGDDAPWPQLIDPRSYCLFHVRFPNGVVKEKFVEWTEAMQYLRHELDAELRRKAYRPNGIVVSSATPISTIGGDAVNAEEVKSLVEDGHLKASSVPPVILKDIFQGANDLEIELTVREELSNLLNTNFSDEVPMPAVEYRSSFAYPIQATQSAVDEIAALREAKSLAGIAQGLRDLTLRGELSIRVLRLMNSRLTKAVNDVMRDGMGLTFEITDFCEDYLELEDFLEKNRGVAMRRVLQGAGEVIANRALTITVMYEDDGDATFALVDNYYNHQVGWDLADIASLNLKEGKAVLISDLAHPVILETLKGMITRANANKETFTGILRLITRDGYYLELVKGRLVEKAHLLKLTK